MDRGQPTVVWRINSETLYSVRLLPAGTVLTHLLHHVEGVPTTLVVVVAP